jgi:hypothetical protein
MERQARQLIAEVNTLLQDKWQSVPDVLLAPPQLSVSGTCPAALLSSRREEDLACSITAAVYTAMPESLRCRSCPLLAWDRQDWPWPEQEGKIGKKYGPAAAASLTKLCHPGMKGSSPAPPRRSR